MRADIVARAPTRIDLGGGWTDVPPYCDREGGFVCNVAITRYSVVRLVSRGVRPSSEEESEVPLASAALLTALAAWSGRPRERGEIAEEGRRIEVEDLAIAGGRQDHYAAAFGGALALTFTSRTAVRRIVLPS